VTKTSNEKSHYLRDREIDTVLKKCYGRTISQKFETRKKQPNSQTVCRLYYIKQWAHYWQLKYWTFFSRPRPRPRHPSQDQDQHQDTKNVPQDCLKTKTSRDFPSLYCIW